MKEKTLYKLCRAGLFAAIICVCAFVSIPVGTVPVTAALLCIMLAGVTLSPFEAVGATVVYVITGALGLPVFSGGSGGIGVLLGPTGGYIWSYPLCAVVIALVCRIKLKGKALSFLIPFAACLLGVSLCYVFGTIQYMLICNASFYTAAVTCILPFIVIDILKSVAAVLIGVPLRKKLKRL